MQFEIFDKLKESKRKKDKMLMGTIDKINSSWGRHTIKLAGTGDKRGWFMNQMNKSPRYTTQWSELLNIN
jgi:DNA polymerase V